ncbi:MAG: hypothetical protein QME47_07240 [Candidatus Thermoplasmatota archaeon]|nr:hypothetical protein [Candidatus Thermoplasmatota archaeon]
MCGSPADFRADLFSTIEEFTEGYCEKCGGGKHVLTELNGKWLCALCFDEEFEKEKRRRKRK